MNVKEIFKPKPIEEVLKELGNFQQRLNLIHKYEDDIKYCHCLTNYEIRSKKRMIRIIKKYLLK